MAEGEKDDSYMLIRNKFASITKQKEMRIGQFHPPRVGEAGGGLERNQSSCGPVNHVQGRRSLVVASTLRQCLRDTPTLFRYK